MDRLETYIRSKRDRFDRIEPPAGHMKRFRERLDPEPVSLWSRIPYGLKIAALLALVSLSSILLYEEAGRFRTGRQQDLQEILPVEFREAQIYYSSLIREKYSEIDRMEVSDPKGKEILFRELDEMDRMVHALMKDLRAHPSDERILSAMITHYQLKLDILAQIIDQLEIANQINSTSKIHHETEI